MAGGLLSYSGLVTKTKAMHSRILSREQLEALSECSSVEEIIGFLREYEGYAAIYQSHEEIVHRAQVEAVIDDSLYSDYGKLYRFANMQQREGLQIIFLRYEISVLKECLENVYLGKSGKNLEYLNLFFAQHAGFDTRAVTEADSVNRFVQALAGTAYEELFRRLAETNRLDYADAAVALDVLYYRTAWKMKEKLSDAGTKRIMTQILGTEIDWQNIMWMYRSKRFFGRTKADTYADMIPISYRLKKAEIKAMLETESIDEFVKLVSKTAYFTEKDAVVSMGDEVTFRCIMQKTYKQISGKYPMSLAPSLCYLYEKENEIDRLTTILEGVRYRVPATEIQEIVLLT